jgi:hypothetical protein
MKRTQLYIDEEEFGVLSVLARQRKKTISELVREAIRKTYFEKKSLDPIKVLEETRGLWKDHEIGKTQKYLRELRKGTRLERFGLVRD